MNSMTGYGIAVGNCDESEVSVEISSVNRKSLEVSVYLPKEWVKMERDILKKAAAYFAKESLPGTR